MKRFLLWGIASILLILLAFISGFLLFLSLGLPSVASLQNYRPKISTQIYSADLIKLGEFSKERRFYTPLEEIPDLVKNAFLAAEDAEFYEHKGVSFSGIARAMIKNLIAGKVKQGGSTISEQTAKVLLLSPERTFIRRAKSVLLALKMERYLSKEEILEIYLNEIYLGEGSYGVSAAAETYFGKAIREVDIGEAALLASLPRAPSKYNPRANPLRAREGRDHVLERMASEGYITQDDVASYKSKDIVAVEVSNINLRHAPYFVEHVRRYLMNKYGEKAVLEDGLDVITTVDYRSAVAGENVLRAGLEEIDRHQGYRGPIASVAASEMAKTIETLSQENPKTWLEGDLYRAIVTKVDDSKKVVSLNTGSDKGTLALEDMLWARKPDPKVYWQSALIKKPSDALRVGDLILVKAKKTKGLFELFQEPKVQGALIAIHPQSGAIQAMSGGYDFTKSEFNRAVQAKRQPGSAFKPFIFTAAIASQRYTSASLISDSPLVFEDISTDSVWKPKNYEGRFKGDMILRDCLIQSRNTPSIRLLQDLGVEHVIEMARNMGIESELKPELALALGSSVVTPMEMARAFSVFANQGKRYAQEQFILKITDREGNILERHSYQDHSLNLIEQTLASQDAQAQSIEVLTPQVAYIMTHLLKQVVTAGTGEKAQALKRPVAGKTGTTDENKDAWFIGYTPQLVTAVWIGYDDSTQSLGLKEDGGKIASPIFTEFMARALDGRPVRDFEMPEGLVTIDIDRSTGALAGPGTPAALAEVFIEGTEPTSTQGSSGAQRQAEEFFKAE